MILNRIEIADFFGHTHAQLDLTGLEAVVVVGANGVGKSSLFVDSVLWALYGQKSIRTDYLASLIREGAKEARAIIEFQIDGEDWTVERRYSEKSSSVELIRQADGMRTEGTVREVEEEIQGLLGADLKAFTLGVCMRQGASSAFTELTPAERIRALAEIVGVSHLRKAFELAGTQQNQLKKDAVGQRRAIDELEVVEEELHDYSTDLEMLQADAVDLRLNLEQARLIEAGSLGTMSDLQAQLDNGSKELADLVEEVHKLDAMEKRAHYIGERRDELSTEISAKNMEVMHIREGFVRSYRGVSIQDIKTDVEVMSDAVSELETIIESGETVRLQGAEAMGRIEAARDSRDYLAHTLKEMTDEAAPLGFPVGEHGFAYFDGEVVEGRLAELNADAGMLLADYTLKQKLTEDRRAAQDDVDALRESSTRVKRQLQDRIDALGGRPPECEMHHCGLIKDAMRAKSDLEHYRKDTSLQDAKKRVERLMAKEKEGTSLADLELAVQAARRRADDFGRMAVTVDKFGGSLARYLEIDEALGSLSHIVESYEENVALVIEAANDLKLGRFIPEITEIDSFEQLAQALSAMKARVEAEKNRLQEALHWHEWSTEADKKEAEAARLITLDAAFENELELMEHESHKLRHVRATVTRTRDTMKRAELALKEASAALIPHQELCAKMEKQLAENQASSERLRGRIEALTAQVDRLQEAREALQGNQRKTRLLGFARDALKVAPVLVIDSTIPRIEQVANDLLAEILPGVHVEIAKQRETRSGDKRDEIHVVVHVDGQTREIKAFSGGQRVIIDLALRLALAKAAAGRASGRGLETLIIDEGWGALDADNVQIVKEAFTRFSRMFGRIIVITHVEGVTDMFEHCLEVTRTPQHTTLTRI